MKIRSGVRGGRGGGWDANHNARKARKIVIKSGVRAGVRGGGWDLNHNPRKRA